MPRSRKRDDGESDPARGGVAVTTKRKRVSLACDACRAAREKCDGVKPSCGPCSGIAQRHCTYTPASKKRGVATGYLRTLESSLAWLFEYSPDSEKALQLFLSEQKTFDPRQRLQQRWTRSRVHEEVTRLLSDAPPSNKEHSLGGDSDQEPDPGSSSRWMDDATPSDYVSPNALSSRAQEATLYQLPAQWRDLIDIHYSHTHQWLPIVNREDLIRTAEAYQHQPRGLALHAGEAQYAEHAQLWAVLALASFQAPNGIGSGTLFSVARSLIPESSTFRQPHVSALLLHSLVLLGQDSPLAACLVVGSACRIALQLHASGGLDLAAGRILTGCCVLNTFISLALGQPAVLTSELNQVLDREPLGGSQNRSLYGEDDSVSSVTGRDDTEVVLRQLNRFGTLLDDGFQKRTRVTTEDLIKSLDSQFSFCNSLIHEESTPMRPSAYLLQLAFLAATVALATHCRPSLLSTVFEVAESCLNNFGEAGTPPLAVALLRIVLARAEKMPGHERQRWEDIIARTRSPWLQVVDTFTGQHQAPALSQSVRPEMSGEHIPQSGTGPGFSEDPNFAQPKVPPSLLYGNPIAQGVDYDAIMEELGSIACNDVIESDPQFMTNLGFVAPDYDLDDIYQQGYFVG